jgi:hypothetical protein
MVELNPHHPVTEELHEQWHKICLLLMKRLGKREILITVDEVNAAFDSPDKNIIAHAKHDGLHVILATNEEAETAIRRGKH